jgi:hypothetical protein
LRGEVVLDEGARGDGDELLSELPFLVLANLCAG